MTDPTAVDRAIDAENQANLDKILAFLRELTDDSFINSYDAWMAVELLNDRRPPLTRRVQVASMVKDRYLSQFLPAWRTGGVDYRMPQ